MSSHVVERGRMVYVRGAPLLPAGDVKEQTRAALGEVDRLLASVGTDKSKLLTAQIRLRNMNDVRSHDEVWNEWVDPANPPVRACVEAALRRPEMLVEVMVTATK